MIKDNYIDNEEMYKELCDLREYGDYDPEVFKLRKKIFKGLEYDNNGTPILDNIESDPFEDIPASKSPTGKAIKAKKNPKTKEEKIKLAKKLIEKDRAYKEYCENKLRNESPLETKARRNYADKMRRELGKKFLLICNGTLKKPNWTNYSDDRKDDMISEATWAMTRYMNRYNLDKDNPFAYFTTVCHRAFCHYQNERKKWEKRYKSLSYIENLDGEEFTLGEYDYEYED